MTDKPISPEVASALLKTNGPTPRTEMRDVDRKRTLAVELEDAPIADLLEALRRRGGTFAAVANAQLLVLRKSADYNQTGMKDQSTESAANADRDNYFPFGRESYVHMVHVKSQRLVSLTKKARAGGEANFEGIMDTALDLINYASFLAEWEKRVGGSK